MSHTNFDACSRIHQFKLLAMLSAIQDYAFPCTHWALGSLVLVGLASSEYSGAGSIVALPIAAIGISLSGKYNALST